MTEDEVRALERDIRSLRELEGSRGWALMAEALKEDVLDAAFGLSDNPHMTEKEVDFRRGAIAAARNMLFVPTRLRTKLENELLLASAQAEVPTTPLNATAL